MKRIDGDALVFVNRVLGIPGGGTPRPTVLDDENVTQILDVNPVVRRSRTPGVNGGWYNAVLRNVHAAAGALTSSIDPYAVGTNGKGGWPSPLPQGLDVWIMTCAMSRSSGAAALDGACLFVDPIARQQGWGVDDMGTTITNHSRFPIARWTGLDSSFGGDPIGITGDGSVMVYSKLRIGRGATLSFVSDADAACQMQCLMVLGLFPEALGQDVAS